MISIIDYGVGNLKSVYKALNKLGLQASITAKASEINRSKAIILPGVGAFRDAICNLRNKELISSIKENVDKGKPILGICLGMQLLYERSFEDGEWNGLGLIPGSIVRFNNGQKIPHMGWNRIKINKEDEILRYIDDGSYVYFVHSYFASSDNSELIAWTDYGALVPAIIRQGNIYGMQFHPEKSGDTGLLLLKAFGEMIT